MATPEPVQIAQLQAENARHIYEPVGFWVREEEEQAADDLLEASEVERMLASEGTWRRKTIGPLARAGGPAFASPIVPLRVAVPAEVFGLIGSFVDLPTSSALSRVDMAWLGRFNPIVAHVRAMLFEKEDRPRLVSLLTKGGFDRSLSIARTDSHLSLRNITRLSISSLLIDNDMFPELSLDKLGLDGSPLQLEVLMIALTGREPSRLDLSPYIRPSVQFLALVNPQTLQFERPELSFIFPETAPNRAYIPAVRHTFHISQAGAAVMRSWTRLDLVVMHESDLHYTDNDAPTKLERRHIFFLLEPIVVGVPPSPAHGLSIAVLWDLTPEGKEPLLGPGALRDPVEYLASRRSLAGSRVTKAFLVLPNEDERNAQIEKAAELEAEFARITIVAEPPVL